MGIIIIVAAVGAGAITGGFNGKTTPAIFKNRVPGSWLNTFDWILVGAAIGLTYGVGIVAIRAAIKLFF